MHKRILVTGGAGFAGSTLCTFLASRLEAVEIIAFDNLKRRGSELNLPRLRQAGVSFVHGDVRNLDDLLAVPSPDLIIECSAEPSAQAGYGGSAAYLIHTNLSGCYHCLELARRCHADFLFVSTSRVYPFQALNALPYVETATRFEVTPDYRSTGVSAAGITEEFPLAGPRSLYGMTKLSAELMTEEFASAYGFRYIVDRFGVLTGPGQMGKTDQGVIALWVAAHLFERPLAYIGFGGTGKQVRDFLHVQDFCELILDQITHFDDYAGRTWNAGGGTACTVSLQELTELAAAETGRRIPVGSVAETRPADVRSYITDHHRVSAVRGWQPRHDAVSTIRDIARWLEAGSEHLRPLFFS